MLPTHPTLTVVIRRPLAVQPIFRICSVPFFCSQAHNNWCMVCIMSVYIYIFFETVNDWQLVFTPNCPISLFKHAHNSRHGPTKREGWNLIVKSFALKMYQIVFVFNGETVKQWYTKKSYGVIPNVLGQYPWNMKKHQRFQQVSFALNIVFEVSLVFNQIQSI